MSESWYNKSFSFWIDCYRLSRLIGDEESARHFQRIKDIESARQRRDIKDILNKGTINYSN